MAAQYQTYRILGRVIDRASRQGVQGMRVEGWDRDTKYHDMLGSAVTGSDGTFSFTFDSSYFGDYAPDRAPDLYFKVYLGDRLIKSTFDMPMMNQPVGDTRVTIEIDYGEAVPAGKDLVSTEQALKAVRFVQQSDFAGVWREGRAKAATLGRFAAALGKNAFAKFDLEPIGPAGARNDEVAGQDMMSAQRNLAARQIEVVEVKEYSPQADRESLRAIADFPLALHAGDRVTLYQQDGKVQYYSIVKPEHATRIDAAEVARIDEEVKNLKVGMVVVDGVRSEVEAIKASTAEAGAQLADGAATAQAQTEEIARLKSDLASVRQTTAEKDAELQKLRADMVNMQAAQRDINARFSPDKLAALEEQVRRLTAGNRGVVSRPGEPAKPAPTRAGKSKTTKPKGKGR